MSQPPHTELMELKSEETREKISFESLFKPGVKKKRESKEIT